MTLREAQLLTLNVLKQVMEEKLDQHNVQLAQVCLLSSAKFVQKDLHIITGDPNERIPHLG